MIVKTDRMGRTIYEKAKGLNGEYSVQDIYYDGLGRVGKVSLPYKETVQAANHLEGHAEISRKHELFKNIRMHLDSVHRQQGLEGGHPMLFQVMPL